MLLFLGGNSLLLLPALRFISHTQTKQSNIFYPVTKNIILLVLLWPWFIVSSDSRSIKSSPRRKVARGMYQGVEGEGRRGGVMIQSITRLTLCIITPPQTHSHTISQPLVIYLAKPFKLSEPNNDNRGHVKVRRPQALNILGLNIKSLTNQLIGFYCFIFICLKLFNN